MQPKLLNKKPKAKAAIRKQILKRKTTANDRQQPLKAIKPQQCSNSPVNSSRKRVIKSNTITLHNSLSSEEEDSIDSINFIKQTSDVKTDILKSLQLFKSANQEYINQNQALEKEVENIEAEFEQVKTEVSEILFESTKSKTELFEIRKKIQETPDKIDTFPKQIFFQEESLNLDNSLHKDRDLAQDKVEELKKEIREIKQFIMENEEGLKDYESENTEFRNITFKLKETLNYEPLSLEYSTEAVTCKSCLII